MSRPGFSHSDEWGRDVSKWLVMKRNNQWWVFAPNSFKNQRHLSFEMALDTVRHGIRVAS